MWAAEPAEEPASGMAVLKVGAQRRVVSVATDSSHLGYVAAWNEKARVAEATGQIAF